MMSFTPALSVMTDAADDDAGGDQTRTEAECMLDQLEQLSLGRCDDEYAVELTKGDFGLGIYFAADASRRAIVDADVPFYRLPDGRLAPGEASGVIRPGDRLVRINDVDTAVLTLPQVVDELRSVPPGRVRLTFRRRALPASMHAWKERGNQTGTAAAAKSEDEDEDEEEPMKEDEDEEEPMKEEATTSAASTPTSTGKSWSVLQRLNFNAPAGRGGQRSSPKSGGESALATDRARELETALERERKCRFLAEKKNILYRNELLRVSQENAALRDQLARAVADLRRLETFAQRHLHLPI